ncbi:unnamed protein product [Haemonchus placei]|uniref:Integrase catalytic domain-containing protein n=1 Tax=Haemonchus placei TaxID=6290 RepID=A0A0N4W6A3_HAEPC|nr:unnamed protein product [Haemonchus placei]
MKPNLRPSEQFKMMREEGGMMHVKTAFYHMQSNGQSERFFDILKQGIKTLEGEEKPSEETLNEILQAYRITPNNCLNSTTPAEVFLRKKTPLTVNTTMSDERITHATA